MVDIKIEIMSELVRPNCRGDHRPTKVQLSHQLSEEAVPSMTSISRVEWKQLQQLRMLVEMLLMTTVACHRTEAGKMRSSRPSHLVMKKDPEVEITRRKALKNCSRRCPKSPRAPPCTLAT